MVKIKKVKGRQRVVPEDVFMAIVMRYKSEFYDEDGNFVMLPYSSEIYQAISNDTEKK